jgi:hypothetical protein
VVPIPDIDKARKAGGFLKWGVVGVSGLVFSRGNSAVSTVPESYID